MIRLPVHGPNRPANISSLRLAPPTAVAKRPYLAGGVQRVPLQVQALMARDRLAQLNAALDCIPQRTAFILRMRFGLTPDGEHAGQEYSLREIAEVLGLSKERIRQLEHEGVVHLRKRLREAI